MWEIWANYLLPKAIKSCPKSNKSPNLVTLTAMHTKILGSCFRSTCRLVLFVVSITTPKIGLTRCKIVILFYLKHAFLIQNFAKAKKQFLCIVLLDKSKGIFTLLCRFRHQNFFNFFSLWKSIFPLKKLYNINYSQKK